MWDLLVELGYEADGLYIGLGIGDYSDVSGGYAQRFADERGLTLRTDRPARRARLRRAHRGSQATRRVPCSACGLSKRHLFDAAARDGGYDVVATGHNLDDEAAVLLGNTLRWDVDYLARQLPVLPGDRPLPAEGQAARAPHRARDGRVVHRARHRLPGRGVPDGGRQPSTSATRRRSTASRPARRAPRRRSTSRSSTTWRPLLARCGARSRGRTTCARCGAPTPGSDSPDSDELCAFCRLVDRASAHEPVPVEMLVKRR